MRRYLLEAIICSFIAIYVATFIGCISATVIRKDCWDLAVSKGLVCTRAGYQCEIWLGVLTTTPSHAEACVIVDGKRIWLQDIGKNSILLDPDWKQPGFEPIIRYDVFRFIEIVYKSGAFKDNIVEGGSKHD